MSVEGVFNYPTRIILKAGAVSQVADECMLHGIKKPFLVVDQGILDLGFADRVTDSLKAKGLDFAIGSPVKPDPIESDVLKLVEEFSLSQCDGFIGIGGGSPVDAAKTISLKASHPLALKEYDDSLGGDKYIDDDRLYPVIAVSTTSGTGAEVSRSSVVFIPEVGRKVVLFSPGMMPKTAILDPELSAGLPPGLTAWTGLDAFTHALEAYLSPVFHPMAEAIAIESMVMIRRYLEKAFFTPSDLEARAQMALAASMAAAAFQKGLGSIHSMAHPLGSHTGLHHGFANAILLPSVTKENAERDELTANRIKRLFEIFRQNGLTSGNDFFSDLEHWWSELEIPRILPELVKKESPESLAALAMQDACRFTNPVELSESDYVRLYKALWP